MTTMISQPSRTSFALGNGPVTKSTGTLAATTVPLFTIAGGAVLVTSLWGRVTTAITVANSYKLQFNPTNGDTTDLTQATDIGTADTAAGTMLGGWYDPDAAVAATPAKLEKGGGPIIPAPGHALYIGQIEHVSAGTDGVILWYATWIALDTGATLVAA
jgi:hypothetical protein